MQEFAKKNSEEQLGFVQGPRQTIFSLSRVVVCVFASVDLRRVVEAFIADTYIYM